MEITQHLSILVRLYERNNHMLYVYRKHYPILEQLSLKAKSPLFCHRLWAWRAWRASGACGMVMVYHIGEEKNNDETMKMPCSVGAMAGGRYLAMFRYSPSARLARR